MCRSALACVAEFSGCGAGERKAPCPDGLFLPQASVCGAGSLGGAQRGSASGSYAVRRGLCSQSVLPSAA